MRITETLAGDGFLIENAAEADLPRFLDIKRICYRVYVDRYYGGWDKAFQTALNTKAFHKQLTSTCFVKILLHGQTAGFFSYRKRAECIGDISIQMVPEAQNRGMGSFFLRHLTTLSARTGKPLFLKVFKSNPARHLYERFGFAAYGETDTHVLMTYTPSRA